MIVYEEFENHKLVVVNGKELIWILCIPSHTSSFASNTHDGLCQMQRRLTKPCLQVMTSNRWLIKCHYKTITDLLVVDLTECAKPNLSNNKKSGSVEAKAFKLLGEARAVQATLSLQGPETSKGQQTSRYRCGPRVSPHSTFHYVTIQERLLTVERLCANYNIPNFPLVL